MALVWKSSEECHKNRIGWLSVYLLPCTVENCDCRNRLFSRMDSLFYIGRGQKGTRLWKKVSGELLRRNEIRAWGIFAVDPQLIELEENAKTMDGEAIHRNTVIGSGRLWPDHISKHAVEAYISQGNVYPKFLDYEHFVWYVNKGMYEDEKRKH